MFMKKKRTKEKKLKEVLLKPKRIDRVHHIDWIGEIPNPPKELLSNSSGEREKNKKKSIQKEENCS